MGSLALLTLGISFITESSSSPGIVKKENAGRKATGVTVSTNLRERLGQNVRADFSAVASVATEGRFRQAGVKDGVAPCNVAMANPAPVVVTGVGLSAAPSIPR
jgi:hypothetical protein